MSLYNSLLERMSGREYNGYFACLCPFHDDHKPSMFVYEDRAYCKTCGRSWSLKQIDKKIGSYFRPNNTVSILPNWRRWEFEYGDLYGIAEHAHKTLQRFPQFQGYIKKRKYEKFIDQGYFGVISGWFVAPVFDFSHKIVDIVCRAMKGKGDSRYVLKPNKNVPRPLYVANTERVRLSESPIYIVFGIFDVWALESIGLPAVSGLTGQNTNPELFLALRKKFVVLPDAGEEQSAHRLANQLGWRCKVKELSWPEGCKDVDEIRRFYGEDGLRELI